MSAADEAWQEWERRNWPMGNGGSAAARASFMAGYRRALEDAADAPVLEPALEVTADRARVWAEGIEAERDFQSTGQPRVNPYTGDPYSPVDADLIARAAAVTPRETKD